MPFRGGGCTLGRGRGVRKGGGGCTGQIGAVCAPRAPSHTEERIMERNMTAVAFDQYLHQDDALKALAGKLGSGVDGDLLISTVETGEPKQNVAELQAFISGDVGLVGKLVVKIRLFLASERAACKKDKKGKKRELDEAKKQRLVDSMLKEQEGQVSSSTLSELFKAHKARGSLDGATRRAAARARFEEKGVVFQLTVPAAKHLIDQQHYKFYQDNKQSLLDGLGFTLVSTESVPGGKTLDKLRVPGSFMKGVFKEREELKEDLRLDGSSAHRPDLRTGPYGCTQFMSWISKKRKDAYAHAPRTMCTT
jgi:hypothetical protein